MSFLKTTAIQHLNASTPAINLTANGRVGIGTSSPSTLIHAVTSNAAEDVFRISNGTQNLNLGVNDGSGGSYVFEIGGNALRFGTNNTERMRIDSSGRVTLPYQPSFKAYSPGGQINNPTNPTNLVFSDTSYAGGHNIGNHYNTSTGVFTAPITGRYMFSFAMLTNPTISGTGPVHIFIYINNTAVHWLGHNHNSSWVMEGSAIIFNLSANDTVQTKILYGSGHYGTYSWFCGCLLG